MKMYWLFIVGLLLPGILSAQRESALGLRAGGAVGITYKKFSSGNFAFEGIVAKDFDNHDDGVFVTALFQNNAPLAGKRFSAIFGAGPSYHFDRKSLGASAILGFDWRVFSSPINFQVDWIPTYYFTGDQPHPFVFVNTALSVRYILNHHNREKN